MLTSKVHSNPFGFLFKSSLLFILALLIAVLSVSYAWLASNRTVDSDGVDMTLETSDNLIISNSPTEIVKADFLTTSDNPFLTHLTFPGDVALTPCTHVLDNGYNTSPTGLIRPKDEISISPSSGLPTKESLLNSTSNYAVAENVQSGATYYIDQTVYIASAGEDLSKYHLYASIEYNGKPSELDERAGAITVDFYSWYSTNKPELQQACSSSYAGYNNAAHKKSRTTNSYEQLYYDKVDLTNNPLCSLYNNIIPSSTKEHTAPDPLVGNYIVVLMRFYFDGNLKGTDGTARIKSTTVDSTLFEGLYIKFEAVPRG
ncbi:MAG: hypothetical protein IJU20_08660 [Clostridia bacterium]|nr:hypothetical protein [Clostridia bacterium]